jgi:uncharacterized protein (DUF2336 family)
LRAAIWLRSRKNKAQEHLNAIAQRATVGEIVTDVLVVKGDETVLGSLADNTGAQFSRTGMETIVERAKETDNLELSLSKRRDVPADLAQEMFWRVSEALLDRLTHHVHILEMNGDSYRLNQSQKRRKSPKTWPPRPWLTRWAHRHLPRSAYR